MQFSCSSATRTGDMVVSDAINYTVIFKENLVLLPDLKQ